MSALYSVTNFVMVTFAKSMEGQYAILLLGKRCG